MPPVRHVVTLAAATIALVVGAWWTSQHALPRVDLPDVHTPSAPKLDGAHLRCGPEDLIADAPPDSAERRLEAELYRAIVADNTSQFVVEHVSIPMPVPKLEHFRDWSPAARALITQGFFHCSELSLDRFPPTAHLAPVAEIDGDLNKLAALFNGTRFVFAFSRARVNEGTGDAVVYYERACRGGCGIGEWIWFRRDAAAWRIAGRHLGWIS